MTEESNTDASLGEFLTALGCTADRQVDPVEVASAWSDRGHVPSEAAMDFVAQFNGISFEYPRHAAVGGLHECVLDAVRATRAISPSRVREYEKRVNQHLVPVGTAASNHVVLMVAETGQVYGGYDDFLALYGQNGKSALWNIYHQISPVRLPPD